jgi:hypothetical protein
MSALAPQSPAQAMSLPPPDPSYQRGTGRGVRCVQLSALRGREGRKERGDEHIPETPPAGGRAVAGSNPVPRLRKPCKSPYLYGVDAGAILRTAGRDHGVVDRRRDVHDDTLEALVVGGVEGRGLQCAELLRSAWRRRGCGP